MYLFEDSEEDSLEVEVSVEDSGDEDITDRRHIMDPHRGPHSPTCTQNQQKKRKKPILKKWSNLWKKNSKL